jgi:conjugal transfer pilin signal peptidase TrbI
MIAANRRPGGMVGIPPYFVLCREHFRQNWKAYTLPLVAVFILQLFVRVDINVTQSLPDHVFLTVKGWTADLRRGDYVAFEWQGGGPYPKGLHFVKIVAGVPGDVISVDEARGFWRLSGRDAVTGQFLGVAKTHSLKGEVLAAGPVGTILPGHYYVMAPHKDSLDSRYAITGWVPQQTLIGKTFALF